MLLKQEKFGLKPKSFIKKILDIKISLKKLEIPIIKL